MSTKHIPLFVVLLAIGMLYVITSPRSISLEDAGLFQMVCHLDGVSHPPGYPLFSVMCQQMIFTTDVIGGNLISVIFALITLFIFYHVVCLILSDKNTAIIATVAYGLSATFWSQAIIIEVYTLATLLFVAAWWLLLKFLETENNRYWFVLCVVFGLGLSNHWPLFLLSGIGFLCLLPTRQFLILRQIRSVSILALSFLFFLFGLLPYVQLLLNSNPEIAVFGPVDVNNFVAYVTREFYADYHVTANQTDKFKYFIWLSKEISLQHGFITLPLVIVGLYRAFHLLPKLTFYSMLVIFLSSTYLLMAMLDFEYGLLYQGVFSPYPIIAYACLSIWFAIGLMWYLEILPSTVKWHKVVITTLVLLSIVLYNFSNMNKRNSHLVAEYGRLILESLPSNAVLFVKGDNETGPLGYLNRVAGVRRDVTLYDVDSLVFSNRMSAVTASIEDQNHALIEFRRKSNRPIFTVSGRTEVSHYYGLYAKLKPVTKDAEHFFVDGIAGSGFAGADIVYDFTSQVEAYIYYIYSLYHADLIRDYHEGVFVYNLLTTFVNQYMAANLVGKLDAQQQARLYRLQTSFPGGLMSLEILMQQNTAVENLLLIVSKLEGQIDGRTPKRHVSLLYGYHGRLLNQSGNQAGAIVQLEAALEISKTIDNICYLRSVYKSMDVADLGSQHMRKLYDGVEYDKQCGRGTM